MARVLNKRTDKIPPDAVCVGRPGKWGNKFRVGLDYSQEEAVRRHELWIKEQIKQGNVGFGVQFRYNLEELREKDLVCWCAPLPCHGDLLLELANKEVDHE